MPDLAGFGNRMKKIADEIEVRSANAIKNVTVAIGRRVVEDTPVDTRKARSNWLASPKRKRDLGDRAPRSIEETVQEIVHKVKPVKMDGTTTLANGGKKVDYLGDLNRGTSFQAPRGFVEASVIAGRLAAFDQYLLKKGRTER